MAKVTETESVAAPHVTAMAQHEIPPIEIPSPVWRVAAWPPTVRLLMFVPVELQTKMTITTLAT
ncbi:MAG: hypothetical protein ACLP5V_13775 [Candidatus Bathyarchaeia archaeon]